MLEMLPYSPSPQPSPIEGEGVFRLFTSSSRFYFQLLQFRHYFWPRLIVGTVWIEKLDPAMQGGVHIAPRWKHGTRLAFLRRTESFYRVRNIRDGMRGLSPALAQGCIVKC